MIIWYHIYHVNILAIYPPFGNICNFTTLRRWFICCNVMWILMGGQVVTKARKFMVKVPTVKMWVCCAWMLCHQLAEWKKSGGWSAIGLGWWVDFGPLFAWVARAVQVC